MYTAAFDPFHAIYRMLQILKHFEGDDIVDVDRLRIIDFYLLFPYKVHNIRLKKTETEFRQSRNEHIKEKKANPYNAVTHDCQFFERLRPYQMIALSHLASYGLIDPELLLQQRVKVLDAEKMQQVMEKLENKVLTENDRNVISWLCLCFRTTPLNGVYGLKYRTQLLESKYDGC